MRIKIMMILAILVLGLSVNSWAMDHAKGHDKHGSGEHATESSDKHDMDHSSSGHAGHDTTFKHTMMEGGLHSEFQVMSLASMNMKDPEGNTHHIMVKMSREPKGEAVKGVIGKIKVIAPSGAEQINSLKDYGGMLAANFTFEEKGKHGIICLVKVGEEKPVFKFWYPHK